MHLTAGAAPVHPRNLVYFDARHVVFDRRGRLLERPRPWIYISVLETEGANDTAMADRSCAMRWLAREVELALRSRGLFSTPSENGNVVELHIPIRITNRQPAEGVQAPARLLPLAYPSALNRIAP